MSSAIFSYDFTEPENVPEAGRSFWMIQNSLVCTFSRALPRRAADLLDVFGAVYAADRRSKRCFRGVAHWTAQDLHPHSGEGAWALDFAGIGDPSRGTAGLGQRRRLGHRVRPPELRLGTRFQPKVSNGRPARIPGNGLAVQRRAGLPGRLGAPCPELTWWLPDPRVRPHHNRLARQQHAQVQADQDCMGTRVSRGPAKTSGMWPCPSVSIPKRSCRRKRASGQGPCYSWPLDQSRRCRHRPTLSTYSRMVSGR